MEVLPNLKTVFIVTVLTSRMIMPGMPSMPAGMTIPGMSPTKSMTMDLTSDKKVDASSKAQCAVPEGLKLGPKVDLEIDLPVKVETAPSTGPAETTKPEAPKFVMKTYWDCSETVLPGQPKVMDMGEMMKGMPAIRNMKARGMTPRVPPAMAAMGDRSHAYWPNSKGGKKIVADSSSPGPYALTTNYCGGTSIAFDKEQEFLAPIEITNPGKGEIDLSKAIKIEWKSVPNARAYVITAFAGKQGEMVMWTSSIQPEIIVNYMGEALSKADVESYVTRGMFLPPTATSCNIPAGIFKDTGAPMISMTAIGVDKTQNKDGIKTDAIVRSTATMMLGHMGPGMTSEDTTPTDKPADTPTDTTTAPTTDTTPTPPSTSPVDKAKDALHKLGNVFGH